jgi:hypothetical protein
MAYKIKSKKQAKGIFDKLKQIERNWELKRKKSQKEKAKYEEIKKKHEEKLDKIYQKELKRLKKIKDKEDEIERVKQLKETARKQVMGLTPQEKAEEQKKWEEKKAKGWEIAKKTLAFLTPKKEELTKAEKKEIAKERKEYDKMWGNIK